MPASCCAHSAKNGIKTPSARPAAKNRNRPTLAGRGRPPNRPMVEDRILAIAVTSKLHAKARGPVCLATGPRTNALADVNAYGAPGRNARRAFTASPFGVQLRSVGLL